MRQNDNVLNGFVSSQAMIEANLSRMPDELMIELTSPEWAARCLDRFEALDTNGDGVLSPEELFPITQVYNPN